MSTYIPEKLRQKVAVRANYRCEYCLRPEMDSFIRYQPDHIIGKKHGGKTIFENLAHSCPVCNNAKGSDLSTVIEENGNIVRLFNPRKDDWADHFHVENGLIQSKTDIGMATIKLLKLNQVNRILERLDLIEAGLFP